MVQIQEYVRTSDKARTTQGDEARTGMKKIQRVPELILDVACENTPTKPGRAMTKQEDSTTAGIYQKIFHHDVLAGQCGALQMKMKMKMKMKEGKLAIFKLAVFIIENFLDDEDGVRSFFGE